MINEEIVVPHRSPRQDEQEETQLEADNDVEHKEDSAHIPKGCLDWVGGTVAPGKNVSGFLLKKS